MVSKDVTFSSGVNTSFSSELNSTIAQLLSTSTSADNTFVSKGITISSGSTTSSSAYETKRTIAIDANAINSFVLIKFNLRPTTSGGGGSAGFQFSGGGYAQLTIDSSQIFETALTTGTYYHNTLNVRTSSPTLVHAFKYSPTSGEKSSGFTIDLDLKGYISTNSLNTASSTGNAINDYWEVWGA